MLFVRQPLIEERQSQQSRRQERKRNKADRALFAWKQFVNLLSVISRRLQTADRLTEGRQAALFASRAHSYLRCADSRLSVDRLWPHDVIHIFLLLQPLACDVSSNVCALSRCKQACSLSDALIPSLTHTHTQWNAWQGDFVPLYRRSPREVLRRRHIYSLSELSYVLASPSAGDLHLNSSKAIRTHRNPTVPSGSVRGSTSVKSSHLV